MKRVLYALFTFTFITNVSAQLSESFSDANFNSQPKWYGDTAKYIVNSDASLQLKAIPLNDTAYLSSLSSGINNAEWQIHIEMDFNPSSSNYIRINVVSELSDMKYSPKGYHIKAGGTEDELSLYRCNGYSSVKIIDGRDGIFNTSVVKANIKLTRDAFGNWQLFSDTTCSGNFISEGTCKDTLYDKTKYFGLTSVFSKTRSNHFRFDDILINGSSYSDTLAPNITNCSIYSDSSIKIEFNETCSHESLSNKLHYVINNNTINVDTLIIDANHRSVIVYFDDALPLRNPFTFVLSNICDVEGNCIGSHNKIFTYFKPSFLDIVINEIMADPDPAVSLPAVEYIEIYNRSSFNISLSGWKIKVGSTSKNISSKTLLANSFLLICEDESAPLLSPFAQTDGIFTSSTTLTNSGNLIELYDNKNQLISFVQYDDDWYANATKAGGGWSLEQIDPSNACVGLGNWAVSKDVKGGSPGQQNSVYTSNPDKSIPRITGLEVLNSNTIRVSFSEYISKTILFNSSNYLVQPGSIRCTSAVADSLLQNCILLNLDLALDKNTQYTLSSENICDCASNCMSSEDINSFAIADDPDSLDLVINEVLFNPYLCCSDMIELYNRSKKVISTSDLRLAEWDKKTGIYNPVKHLTETGILLFPGDYLAITTKRDALLLNYFCANEEAVIETSALPSMNNDAGHIYLINKSQKCIDEIAYTESMHYAFLQNKEGVSLERINPERPSNDLSNWHSAAEDVGFATPGYKNSQYTDVLTATDKIIIDPELFSPDNDGYHDQLNIAYKLNKTGYTATAAIFDAAGRRVRLLKNNELLSNEGSFSWDGVTDNGTKAAIGIYIIYIEMFEPNGGVEHFKKVCVVAEKIN